ncbi:MAG: type II secretion system F family protein, partial [Gammaproteobacteria bacterium]|nr:type II secretion system F family protein [Gammaproteobacteria bacterium]
MAVAAPKAEKADVFIWEGADKRGKRLKGESRAANMALVRAELRRQGINPLKVKKKSTLFTSRKKKITA